MRFQQLLVYLSIFCHLHSFIANLVLPKNAQIVEFYNICFFVWVDFCITDSKASHRYTEHDKQPSGLGGKLPVVNWSQLNR